MRFRSALPLALALATALPVMATGTMPPIRNVEVGPNRELRVNGAPFLPIMLFCQSDERIPDGLSIAVNTFASNCGDLSDKEYLDKLLGSGLYGVVSFAEDVIGHPSLLGWIHGDEPDNRSQVSDAEVIAGEGMNLNPSTPLMRLRHIDSDR